jgi:hypothetical protein
MVARLDDVAAGSDVNSVKPLHRIGSMPPVLQMGLASGPVKPPAETPTMRELRWMAALLLLVSGASAASDVCGDFARRLQSPSYGERVAGVACHESLLWHRPFIDREGRLASQSLTEAESGLLTDGATPAWQRVVAYWRDSGLLWRVQQRPGASECAATAASRWHAASCRAFLMDTPWSAAFVSWVLVRAGVPGFRPSASHVDYVRDAHRASAGGPYAFHDPMAAAATPGDLLCFVRVPQRVFGHAGLAHFLAAGNDGLNMHCDVVVGNNRSGDGLLTLVGGNVLQGVTLRQLPVNRDGLPWGLPMRAASEPVCRPDVPQGCNFNRQDWAVLLRLRPQKAAQGSAPRLDVAAPRREECCVHCVLGAEPHVPRCPSPSSVD